MKTKRNGYDIELTNEVITHLKGGGRKITTNLTGKKVYRVRISKGDQTFHMLFDDEKAAAKWTKARTNF